MKKPGLIIWISLTAVVFFISTAFVSFQSSAVLPKVTSLQENPVPEEGFAVPEDVQKIFESSCFGCHNVESSSEKAQKKFLVAQLPDLSKVKLISKLGDISEVIEENEMPPKKFLAKYPDKALTENEAKRLKEWADQSAEELMK